MAETKQEPPLHVVVFPWLAFGHIVPFLELAEQLAAGDPELRATYDALGADGSGTVA